MARNIEENDDSTAPKKKAKGMPVLLIIGIVAGVVVLGCGGVSVAGMFVYWASAKKTSSTTDPVVTVEQDKQKLKPIDPQIEDNAPAIQFENEFAIVNAYRENSIAADAKAKGKKVTFTMNVQEVGRIEGKAMIAKCTTADSYFTGPPGQPGSRWIVLPNPPNFYAFAADENDPILGKIKKGDSIVVTGYLKGRFDDGVVRGMGTKDEAFRIEVERCTYRYKTSDIPEPTKTGPGGKARFNESDVNESALWLQERYNQALIPRKNQIAEPDDPIEVLKKELESFAGRKVKWEFKGAGVEKLKDGEARVAPLRTSRMGPNIFVISSKPGSKPIQDFHNAHTNGVQVVPTAAVAKIAPEKAFNVEGTIVRVHVPQPYKEGVTHPIFVLENVTISDAP